jgi:hypothetical protein
LLHRRVPCSLYRSALLDKNVLSGHTVIKRDPGITVLEPTALIRWYFLGKDRGLFAQADLGGYPFVFGIGVAAGLPF